MKSILHFVPTLERGGAERQLTMLASHQARRGWRVHVASRRGGPHERALAEAGVTLHRLGDLRGLHPLLVAQAVRLALRLRPDVIQTWIPQMDVVGGLAATLTRVPWLLSERTATFAGIHPIVMHVRKRVARHAGAIAANSRGGVELWENTVGSRIRIERVTNAVDVDGIEAARRDATSSRTVLFAARLSEEKAPEQLVAAARLYATRTDAETLMLGEGPLHATIAASLHGVRVQLLPYRDDFWSLLKTASVFVSTSRWEGQPNAVLEAMAARCPVILTDIPAHREIADERSAWFVRCGDPRALADAIVATVERRELGGRIDAAYERVRRLTTASVADAHERIYAQLRGA
jgi:glycosyltransferase involved in cell wall biosynthesis